MTFEFLRAKLFCTKKVNAAVLDVVLAAVRKCGNLTGLSTWVG